MTGKAKEKEGKTILCVRARHLGFVNTTLRRLITPFKLRAHKFVLVYKLLAHLIYHQRKSGSISFHKPREAVVWREEGQQIVQIENCPCVISFGLYFMSGG